MTVVACSAAVYLVGALAVLIPSMAQADALRAVPVSTQATPTQPPSARHRPAQPHHRGDRQQVKPRWHTRVVKPNRPHLDTGDELAALAAVQTALDEVGDGATFVWHRANGRLSGLVKLTSSFRDKRGLVCRHLEVWLTAGVHTRKTEGIACRDGKGVWALEG